jgi:hypothetical protein
MPKCTNSLLYQIVECSFLRVIGTVPWPTPLHYSTEFVDCIKWMLTLAPRDRPFIDDVLNRIGEFLLFT